MTIIVSGHLNGGWQNSRKCAKITLQDDRTNTRFSNQPYPAVMNFIKVRYNRPPLVKGSDVRSTGYRPVEVRHMNTREAKRAVLLREWALMIQQRQESGLPATEWCKQNGIPIDTYHYRLRQVRKAVLEYNELLPAKRDSQSTNPILVKVDTDFPVEQPSALEIPSASEAISICEPASRSSSFRLKLDDAILDIPVGTRAKDIGEVLKAVKQYAV